MADDPINTGRSSDGRFAAGNQLGGKPRGARHKITRAVEQLLEGEAEGLTRKAIEMALEGDTTALRLCLDRIAPARKDAPISLELPPITSARDAVVASSAVLSAVAAGEISPSEAASVMRLLVAHRGVVETADLERRIEALEQRK
jgi:hypothetical protein